MNSSRLLLSNVLSRRARAVRKLSSGFEKYYMVGFLLVALFLVPHTSQPKSIRSDWRPATFRGLVVGKSRRADMLRRLGQPKWSRSHEGREQGEDERETF